MFSDPSLFIFVGFNLGMETISLNETFFCTQELYDAITNAAYSS